jgi:protein-L-isoaspartate O-methyltransferase
MNGSTFHRLHELRMENDAARYRQDDMRPRFDRLANRHENGTAPRAVSAYQLFQTPVALAARLVEGLQLNRSHRVLEPSAGLGRILDAIKPHAWDVVAVEQDATLAGELYRQERPEVRILQRDFLTCTVAELGQFDRIAMNPPFHVRADIRHIEHALKFLKPGGRLGAIMMNTRHRVEALKDRADSWEALPDDTFKETGTRVSTVLAYFTA